MAATVDRSTTRILDRGDRCDACPAQAAVAVYFAAGSLLLCGHHFRRHEQKLRQEARLIVDETQH